MTAKQVPSIGRVVHYILPSGPKKGEHRAAMVVRVWSDECVNLRVFLDGNNDYDHEGLPHYLAQTASDLWVTSASYADPTAEFPQPKDGTWHWPEYVSPARVEPCTE